MDKSQGTSLYKTVTIFFTAALIVSASALAVVWYIAYTREAAPVFNLSQSIDGEAWDLGTAPETDAAKATGASDPLKEAAARIMENADLNNTIYENIYIAEVHVGGLTAAEARDKVYREYQLPLEELSVDFTGNGVTVSRKFSDFGARYNISEAVDKAVNYAAHGEYEERRAQVLSLSEKPYRITLEYVYANLTVSSVVEELSGLFYTPPVEPVMSRVDGRFVVTNGIDGFKMDTAMAADDAFALIADKKSGVVHVSFINEKPKYTADFFEAATDKIGAFQTGFRAGDTNRNANLALASSRIDNIVVMPGEVFSTNAHFNPDKHGNNGYLEASSFLQGRVVDSVGGGICQVASTLYMALLHAELEITERSSHSMGVSYLDYGFDATLAGDYIDLKFRNNTDYPVTIVSYVSKSTVSVEIYGFESRPPGRSISFENALIETTPPPDELVTHDPALPQDKRVVDLAPKNGYRYRLYKLVYVDGVLSEKIQINTSTYKPVRGEVRIGTKPEE